MTLFDTQEHEANAQGSHHIHLIRGQDPKRIIEQVNREALETIEPYDRYNSYNFEKYGQLPNIR